ncbi:LPXTG cell wall anchor domain-containing protein [Enterococcus saccharolyticus]
MPTTNERRTTILSSIGSVVLGLGLVGWILTKRKRQ